MRTLLVLMVGLALGLMTPQLSEAHKGKQDRHQPGYSQHHDGPRGHAFGYYQQERHRDQHKAWKKHRKEHRKVYRQDHRKWHRHHDHRPEYRPRHRSERVVYRETWPFPLISGIVIHLPL